MSIFASRIEPFDWNRILWSADASPWFLLEIAFRCLIVYLMVIAALRVTGRRGVRQLSIFELSIILALGSAAGDAMFYGEVPLLHVLVVFVLVSGLYWLFNRFTEWYPRFGDWLEGTPVLLIDNGEIHYANLQGENLTQKELFGGLRGHSIEHLGQVRRAYVEATCNFSVYFFADADVRHGLPIWPEKIAASQRLPADAGPHACTCCGHVLQLARATLATCPVCDHDEWVPACDALRVA